MYNSACCVNAVHITSLQWESVIHAKGLIIWHVIHAVSDFRFMSDNITTMLLIIGCRQ
jgi:hypothetical protein